MLSGEPAPQHGSGSEPVDLGALFGSLVGGIGQNQVRARRQRSSLSEPLLRGGVIMDDTFGGLPLDWIGAVGLTEPSRLAVSDIRDLFPISVLDGEEQEDPWESDQLLSNMLQHVSTKFKKEMLPAIQRAACAGKLQDACSKDASKAACNGTRSQLHCLGQHPDQISEECRKEVGKSVPFRCSSAIDELCNVLERGILPCLADHLDHLSPSCRDAVVATHSVIAKVNMQKASMRDPQTGGEVVHVPMRVPETLLPPPADTKRSLATGEVTQQARKGAHAADPEEVLSDAIARPDFQLLTRSAGQPELESTLPGPALHPQLLQLALVLGVAAVGMYLAKATWCNSKSKRNVIEGALLELEKHDGMHIN